MAQIGVRHAVAVPDVDETTRAGEAVAVYVERVARDKRDTTIALLHECLGQALAQYVLTGGAEH